MLTVDSVKHLHVELTTRCQAACPLCARNDRGFKTRTDFPVTELSIEQWQKIFDSAPALKLNCIVFNGNFGEPTMAADILQIIDYCFNRWPYLYIELYTNGGVRNTAWWADFGNKYQKKNLKVFFSIDGLEDTNHLYRINVPYAKVIENAKSFIRAGGKAVWKMIPFQHNEHQIETAKQLSVEYGFVSFLLSDQNRDAGFVFTTETTGYILKPADYKNKETHHKILPEKFTPITASKDWDDYRLNLLKEWLNNDKKLDCVTLNEKSVYVAANGELYPCCHIGHFPKVFTKWKQNFSDVVGNVDNNAIDIGFEQAINWFDRVENSWSKNSLEEGLLSSCLGCSIKSPLKTAEKITYENKQRSS